MKQTDQLKGSVSQQHTLAGKYFLTIMEIMFSWQHSFILEQYSLVVFRILVFIYIKKKYKGQQ